MRREVEAIGTNAHELPMVYCGAGRQRRELAQAPYQVLADWQEEHDGNLRIILPDTYGTEGFLRERARLAGAAGPASASIRAIRRPGRETAIRWWKSRGEDPRKKLVIFSDGLDVDKIEALHRQFHGRVQGRLRLGHAADQRFPRSGRRTTRWRRSASSARRSRPTGGRRSSCRTIPTRPWARPTRSRATSASSASARSRLKRCWCRAGFTPPPPCGHQGVRPASIT